MQQPTRVRERTAIETSLTDLLGSAAQPMRIVAAVGGAAGRLQMPVAVANGSALSVHEWIPMGALSDRTQCRCCHCGVVRRYDLSRDARVHYSKYTDMLSEGELETTDVPACAPAGSRMPLSVGARCWDMLSWV